MTPERWCEVQKVLHAALERPPSERAAFLQGACTGDTELISEVVSLVASAEEAGDFLETPVGPAETDGAEEEPLRRRIGPYQVVRLLGSGGMGHVYLALRTDEQFQKWVAIKVVKRGTDTDFVLRRFRQERQILAGLDHPNIAQLLDGGNTEDGLPYFVMEYVEGEPITAYCDRRGLGVRERIGLFRTACAAVQFAHQNLVVHRDLKPGNILITDDGIPKLLDFGIAKLLNPESAPAPSDMTAAGLQLFTPDYASPEQIRGERITTASDVYSLGVLLYELMTGRRPYRGTVPTTDKPGPQVRDEEPEKPSRAVTRPPDGAAFAESRPGAAERQNLRRLLSGDLDTIVLKAMRGEPGRRYASVEQLSEDLRRHLEGLPVSARKDTVGYRAGKLLRRHRVGAAAAALVLLSLLGGIAATSWQARIARREHDLAERRLRDVRQIVSSFLFELHGAIASLPGSTPARELLVRHALKYLRTLAGERAEDPSLRRELADAYEKLGTIQGGSGPNLGDTAGAIASTRAALEIRETTLAADPGDPRNADDLAACLERLAGILGSAGRPEEASRLAERALAVRQRLVGSDPKSRTFRSGLARAHFVLSNQLFGLNRSRDEMAEMAKARSIYEALAAEDPSDLKSRRSLALADTSLASARLRTGEAELALQGYRTSEAIERGLMAAEPTNAVYKQDLSRSYAGIGAALFALGHVAEGTESYRKALTIRKELADADPKDAWTREALARGYLNLGRQQVGCGDARAALESLGLAIPIFEALAASDPESARKLASLADGYGLIGMAHEKIAARARPGSKTAGLEWSRARQSDLKAIEVYDDLESKGKLAPQLEDALEKARDSLRRADAALNP